MITDFIIDLETLSDIEHNAAILSIAAVSFTLNGEDNIKDVMERAFHMNVKYRPQLENKTHVLNRQTLAFWKQNPDAWALQHENPVTLDFALNRLVEYLYANGYDHRSSILWTRGSGFDGQKIEYNMRLHGLGDKLNQWQFRDIRTYVDLYTGVRNGQYKIENPANIIKGMKHYARYDVAKDVVSMQEIYKGMFG